MKKWLVCLFCFLFLNTSFCEQKPIIGIFTSLAEQATPWDPDSISSGIAGSEEAVIYISQELADLGYQVYVFGTPPKNSPHSLPSANPRFVPINFELKDPLDIAIAWRLPDLGEVLKPFAKNVYFWPHDTWNSPLSESQINAFTDVLWLSKWQREQWASVNPGFSKFTHIFGNGINPDQFSTVKERKNPYSCIYSSNYSRGLEVLLEIWPAIKKDFPQATLDIYYGWQHWGLLSSEKETKLRNLIRELKPLGVEEHGKVGHEDLAKAFENTSFWTYPCTAAETFCITAIKAQLAGTIPVVIRHSALNETVRSGYSCLDPKEYLDTLKKAMNEVKEFSIAKRQKAGEFVLNEFTWKGVASKWKALFDKQSEKKKTICLNMIVKDESPVIRRSLASVKPFIDYWVIVDTGSTDGTQEIIRDFMKDIPGELHERPWINFADNRNEALELAKGKADYLLFIDADEELLYPKGFSLPELNQDYYYSILKLSSFSGQRKLLVNNHLNWRWEGIIHELLVCPEAQTYSLLEGIVNSAEAIDGHRSQDPQKFLKDAQVLEAALEKDPNNPHHLLYLAQSYMLGKKYEPALKSYEKFMQVKTPDLVSYPALYNMGILSELLNEPSEKVINNYLAASKDSPSRIEPIFRLSVYYFMQKNYLLAYSLAKTGLNIPNPHERIYNEDWIYEYGIHFALANAAFALDKFEEAQKGYKLALENPQIPEAMALEIRKNLDLVEEKINQMGK